VTDQHDPPLGHDSISACLILRNEEHVVERCLRSFASVVDEIVLVHDGPCTDRTLEIAERYGSRIFVRPLVGHAEVSTVFAYEQARGEWILSIDADEFLSDDLRAAIRELARAPDVNGYEFLWRVWNGERYITEQGPYKQSLYRRAATHVLGLIHSVEVVDPPIRRTDLQLEHRPPYNNFALRTMITKWRRWARINARELLMDFSEIPKFNWTATSDWPRRRRVLNRLSPVLFLPYALAVFAYNLRRERSVYSVKENLRLSLYQGLYGGMVQFYVAKYLYLGSRGAPALEAPRPTSSQPPT